MADRRAAAVLLAALGAAVFLAGLELMITAVALPAIVPDLATWRELRRASWIVNGYLVVAVVTMPLAGRLADHVGPRRVFLGGLGAFVLGSLLAGAAQDLDALIVARLVQAVGGGSVIPVATAGAAHLFDGQARPRALGAIGGLTFLGMAAGPFAGALVLQTVHPDAALARLGIADGPLPDLVSPAWRWVFYLNVPIGLVALAVGWAASAGWRPARTPHRLDLPGAATFSVALAAAILGLTWLGSREPVLAAVFPSGLAMTEGEAGLILLGLALGAAVAFVLASRRRPEPFLDPGLFRRPAFASAALVSLLTGYGLATATIGGAVYVDRVLYGGPDAQQVVLGGLAAATAVGAVGSGFLVRRASLRVVTLLGLGGSFVAFVALGAGDGRLPLGVLVGLLVLYGLGFGLTVTPRSTAAVEALGATRFGLAAATVTVARMIGMAVGLAALTAYGATTIERLTAEVYATPDAYRAYIPVELRDRPLRDGLVVEALEDWASRRAAEVLRETFVVAGVVTALAVLPAAALDAGRRPRDREGVDAERDAAGEPSRTQ
jgi:MFS family permease